MYGPRLMKTRAVLFSGKETKKARHDGRARFQMPKGLLDLWLYRDVVANLTNTRDCLGDLGCPGLLFFRVHKATELNVALEGLHFDLSGFHDGIPDELRFHLRRDSGVVEEFARALTR